MLVKLFTTHVTYQRPLLCLAVRRMSNSVNIKFKWGLSTSDPEQKPVLFVGQAAHIAALSWQDVKCKMEPRVTEEVWRRAVSVMEGGEVCEVWPRGVALGALPPRRSRHAAPARSHALSKLVRTSLRAAANEFVVLVCRKRDVVASAVGIARALPLYSACSGPAPLASAGPAPRKRTLTVEIHLATDEGAEEDDDLDPLDPVLLDGTLSTEDLKTVQDIADATRLAARITDTPANIMDVDAFIQEAINVAKDLDISPPTIIRGEELKERGMGGIYGVGKAAARPPALVTLSYTPPEATETVAWVGKGIVYDTGGLSLKTPKSMCGMKYDCGGAAGALGAFSALVRSAPALRLHAVLCLAENAVGPQATRPDDIHTLYSGRTVEINNTDAEGRLVLSDGVVYAQRDLKADTIVDIATLTGAQAIATGKHHAAVVCNDARLEASCIRAGRSSGDLTHALPYAPELHFYEFSSAVADMKNSVADRENAQSSCAGLFMLAHLGFDFPGRWLHIDMAAPSRCGDRATGYGVALLTVLFGSHSRSKLLKALCPTK